MKRALFLLAALLLPARILSQSVVGSAGISIAPPAASGAAGWTQVPSTTLTSLCPTYSDIQGTTGCPAVESAWGSAAIDNARNAIVIHGGGHVDYYGTETYRCAFASLSSATCSLFSDSAHGSAYDAVVAACGENLSSPLTPTSRHDYSGFIYLPNQDKYFLYGAGISTCGNFSDGNYVQDPTAGTWTNLAPSTHPNTASNGSVPQNAYNPIDGCIYFLENNIPNFWKQCYDNFAGANWTALTGPSGAPCDSTNADSVIDVSRQLFVCAGGGNLYTIALSNSATVNDTAASGCSTVAASTAPGIGYDPVQQLVVFWFGGNSIVYYNATSHSCTTFTPTGTGPGVQLANGTYQRFAYMPGIGAFVVANGIGTNLYTLQLTAPATAANMDFANRVAAASTTASEGFDSAGEFVAVTSGRGFWKAFGGSSPIMSQDTTTYRSGGGSAVAIVPALSSDQPVGYYAMGFASTVAASNLSVGKQVQFSWAQRFDAAYIQEQAPAIGGGFTYWKQFISSWWDGASNFNSCGNPDFVVVNDENEQFPLGYAACGDDPFQVSSSLAVNGIWNEFNRQLITSGTYNGTTQTLTGGAIPSVQFNCPYTGTTTPSADCAAYPANTWVTYKCEIVQGTFGAAATTFQCWQSTPQSPAWRQWLYSPNHVVSQDGTDVYNVLQLQPYWTSRDNTKAPTPNLGTAHTWYDEVVICMGTSSAPCNILPPQAPPAAP